MTPRRYDEFLFGTARQFTTALSGRAYFRYRKGTHYWEDTPNMARLLYAPPRDLPGTDVSFRRRRTSPNLADQLARSAPAARQQLRDRRARRRLHRLPRADGRIRIPQGPRPGSRGPTPAAATTATSTRTARPSTADAQRRQHLHRLVEHRRWRRAASCGTTSSGRCAAIGRTRSRSIGSYYLLVERLVGFYAIAQSGQPWETHSFQPYAALTTCTSNTDRYAEPAGSHRAPSHAQLDLNYTQDVPFLKRYQRRDRRLCVQRVQLADRLQHPAELQRGRLRQPHSFFDPRRIELTLRLIF